MNQNTMSNEAHRLADLIIKIEEMGFKVTSVNISGFGDTLFAKLNLSKEVNR